MTNQRKLAAYALTATLLLGSGGAAFAQTSTGGNAAGGTVTTTGQSATDGSGSTMNRAGGDDNDFDWGWLGLLGLIGLAGLMRRDRVHDRYHQTGAGATTR
jgi:hypothetical protein